ncbi:MAG: MgtC/SapB family protein [Armatimonadota bacterium]
MFLLDMGLRLLLSILAGALVGLERERQDRPAGLRTHILVCMGSTLFTYASLLTAGADGPADPGRIAAQIVSGIGFLGAGTIFRSDTGVRGLTTAAGLWVVAAIGMGVALGGSMMILAVFAALLVYALNRWVRDLENLYLRTNWTLVVGLRQGTDGLARVLGELEAHRVEIRAVRWLEVGRDTGESRVSLELRLRNSAEQDACTRYLGQLPGVTEVRWE